MFCEMKHACMSNCVNTNFIREMIPHHCGAIAMSVNTLRYCICPELVPILESIIATQRQEVCQMRRMLRCMEHCQRWLSFNQADGFSLRIAKLEAAAIAAKIMSYHLRSIFHSKKTLPGFYHSGQSSINESILWCSYLWICACLIKICGPYRWKLFKSLPVV